jgi:hypothetical protein
MMNSRHGDRGQSREHGLLEGQPAAPRTDAAGESCVWIAVDRRCASESDALWFRLTLGAGRSPAAGRPETEEDAKLAHKERRRHESQN